MGKSWTTKDQVKWLEEKLPGYLQAQQMGRLGRYLVVTQDQWFKTFPERNACFPNKHDEFLTEDEQNHVDAAIKTRQTQISNWLSNHARLLKASLGNTRQDAEIIKALNLETTKLAKAERAPHKIEAYLKLFAEKCQAEYERESARLEASAHYRLGRGPLLQLRRNVATELLLNETEENKQKVTDFIDEWYKTHRQNSIRGEEDEDEDPTFVTPTPAEYQKSIDAMPKFLETVFKALSQASGWSFVVLAGGPIPKEGGQVFVEDYHFGRESPTGNDFRAAYEHFDKVIVKPLGEHMLNCYPPHMRASRALSNSIPTHRIDAERASASTSGTPSLDQTRDDHQEHRTSDPSNVSTDQLRTEQPARGSQPAFDNSGELDGPGVQVTAVALNSASRGTGTTQAFYGQEPPNPLSTQVDGPSSSSYGPDAPGGPTEHISQAFVRMGLQNGPLYPVSVPTNVTQNSNIDPHLCDVPAPPHHSAVAGTQAQGGASKPSAGKKRKQAESSIDPPVITDGRPRREVRAPPRADRDVEIVPKANGKKKAKK
ncbi:hypothetical protein BJ912DRAFT_1087045 [Pholiota molesta]|nr:hypothetical protein BJ912DRAFT_1087045 [Pholiota molesta]